MERKTATLFNLTAKAPLFPVISTTFSIKRKLLTLVFSVALLQLLLRLGCLGEYGFHQDELLYLALSDHLAWGYREVPPFIALIGTVSKSFFGDSVAAARIIPSLCAASIVVFTGLITIKLGGKFFAVAIACSIVAFSPAFLAAGALFIPQVFDELFWILSAYLLLSFFQTKNAKLLLYFGIICGLGLLTKYTFLLYSCGLLIGIAMQPSQRILFGYKHFWWGLGIGLFLFLPHLWWQYLHHFPAFYHYNELQQTQLVYLERSDFLIQQLMVNGTGAVIWLIGLYIVFTAKFKNYRFFGIAFLLVMVVLLVLNGKPYYAFGSFPPLFAIGAIFLERRLKKTRTIKKIFLFALFIIPNLLLSVIVLPYLPIEKTAKVFEWTYNNLGIHYPLKWEDQKIHNMNQNYADMIGWEELAQKTAKLYQSLPSISQKQTIILAEKYGEAGAIDQYRKDYALPPVISLCSSYALWAPEQLPAKHIIYISINPPPKFTDAQTVDQITNPYSRVVGMRIYLLKNIESTKAWYNTQWKVQRKNKNQLTNITHQSKDFL
jgi:hypothetical protein